MKKGNITALALIVWIALTSQPASATIVNFEDQGALAESFTYETSLRNGDLLNRTLKSLKPGDTLLIPNNTYYLMGGI